MNMVQAEQKGEFEDIVQRVKYSIEMAPVGSLICVMDVAKAVGEGNEITQKALNRLRNRGLLERVHRGRYIPTHKLQDAEPGARRTLNEEIVALKTDAEVVSFRETIDRVRQIVIEAPPAGMLHVVEVARACKQEFEPTKRALNFLRKEGELPIQRKSKALFTKATG